MASIGTALIFFAAKHPELRLDEDDLSKFGFYTACFNSGYVQLAIGRTRHLLHRVILDFPEGEIDHINGNKLDNRKENLRLATRTENNRNKRKYGNATSEYKGVHLKSPGRWASQITLASKHIHIGYYSTAEEAAKAYDRKAKELFGEFAHLNFPEET